MNVVILTAIFGDKDDLIEPAFSGKSPSRMVCFSDVPRKSDSWEVVVDRPTDPDPRRSAKLYKICPHRFFDCDVSVWVDGRALIKRDFLDFIRNMEHDISMFVHPGLTCAYQELNACIRLDKDSPKLMRAQMRRYRADGFPENYGLIAGGCIVRRHVKSVEELDEMWWEEIIIGSVRDQLSFNYCAWKLGHPYGIIPGCYWDNDYIRIMRHKK